MSCFANLYPPKAPLKKQNLGGSNFYLLLICFNFLKPKNRGIPRINPCSGENSKGTLVDNGVTTTTSNSGTRTAIRSCRGKT